MRRTGNFRVPQKNASVHADRTLFAAERTYNAWVRTGLLALASGIGAKALLTGLVPDWLILANGSVLVLFSMFCFGAAVWLSLIHISEPTRLLSISYAVFCLKK